MKTILTLTTTVIITAATTFVKVTSNKGKKYINIKLLRPKLMKSPNEKQRRKTYSSTVNAH